MSIVDSFQFTEEMKQLRGAIFWMTESKESGNLEGVPNPAVINIP